MTDFDREAHYRRYIGYLNDRRVDDLQEFVSEELTYNGEPMSRMEYQNLITRSIATVPDLYFGIHVLVSSGDHIACRLKFDCTPQSEFLGQQPNGKSISFSEHPLLQVSRQQDL